MKPKYSYDDVYWSMIKEFEKYKNVTDYEEEEIISRHNGN